MDFETLLEGDLAEGFIDRLRQSEIAPLCWFRATAGSPAETKTERPRSQAYHRDRISTLLTAAIRLDTDVGHLHLALSLFAHFEAQSTDTHAAAMADRSPQKPRSQAYHRDRISTLPCLPS